MKEKQRRRLIVREMNEPNNCFCEKKELNPNRNYETDEILFYTDDWIHPVYGNLGKQPYRKCQICGKAYYSGVLMA